MKKRVGFLLTALMACVVVAMAQQKQYQVYGVGFYNLENLFDTVHDVGKNDVEYLPNGANKWGSVKYTNKLHNMARAVADMGTDVLKGVGCAVIGVSEVENANALTDLVNEPELKARGFKFCHIEGPDRRGVDCALLYNPKLFALERAKLVPYVPELEKDSLYVTRGFLTVSGMLGGDHVAFIVCHWPSQYIGSFYRESAGRQVRAVKDSLLEEDPNCKVLVMGDMNDDPHSRSMSRELRARRDFKDMRPHDMYNPWWKILDNGTGTLTYQGRWNLFDQIVLAPNLLNMNEEERDFTQLKYWKAQIQRMDYLMQTEGSYKGSPKRTHAGGVWLNGYSDHLPVVVYLMKEKEAVMKDIAKWNEGEKARREQKIALGLDPDQPIIEEFVNPAKHAAPTGKEAPEDDGVGTGNANVTEGVENAQGNATGNATENTPGKATDNVNVDDD